MITIEERAAVKLPGMSSLFVSFPFSKQILEVVKGADIGIFNDKTKEWELSVNSLAYLIDNLSNLDDITLHFLKDKIESNVPYKLHKHKTEPFDYQVEGIQYGLAHDKWLLLDAPGLGKTLQIIYLAEELKARDNIQHCLVICGINTLKSNWKREIEKHSKLSCKILGERISSKGNITIGSIKDRVYDLKHKISEFFVVTNIETLRNDEIVEAIKKGKNNFDMIVVDEVHTCKSSQSQQGKHLLKLTNAKYRIAATGTLLLNNPLDTYVPLKWIGAEKSSFSNFRYYYCKYGGPFHNVLVGFKNLKTLKQQLEKYSLRRTKDLLNLPPKTIINEYVDMSDQQQFFYNNIKQGIIDQVDKVHMTAASVLGMVTRLRQATACPQILTTENIPSAKLDRACDLCEQIIEGGYSVVIFSTFKESVYKLQEKLQKYSPLVCTGDVKDAVITENMQAFQLGRSPLLLATWQKMGTGITLTKATYAIFIDVPWTNAVYEQAQDRIYRIGTTDKVFIYHLITKDTIDERVLELVEDKAAVADYVVDDKISQSSLDNLRKYIEELQ